MTQLKDTTRVDSSTLPPFASKAAVTPTSTKSIPLTSNPEFVKRPLIRSTSLGVTYTFLSPLQFLKASDSIFVTLFGIVTLVSPL